MVAVENKVISMIADELNIKEDALSMETLLEDIFDDSLDYIHFITRLAEIGNITDLAVSQCETIGDICNALEIAN